MRLTTTYLQFPTIPRSRLAGIPIQAAIGIIVFCLFMIVGLIGQLHSAAPSATATPQLPIIIIASPLPVVPPTAVPAAQVSYQQPATPRYVVGFDSPNGRALGAIPAPEASAIVARFGDDWLQTTHDGAPIWIRASELGMNLADVAPVPAAPAPQVVYVAQQSPQEAAPAPIAPTAALYAAEPVAPVVALPVAAPVASAPADVQREWAAEQWRQEQCIAGVCQ